MPSQIGLADLREPETSGGLLQSVVAMSASLPGHVAPPLCERFGSRVFPAAAGGGDGGDVDLFLEGLERIQPSLPRSVPNSPRDRRRLSLPAR